MLLRLCIAILGLQLLPSDVDNLYKLTKLSEREHAVFLCYGDQQNWVVHLQGGRVAESNPRGRSGHTIPALSPDLRYVAFVKPAGGGPDDIIITNLEDKSSRELMKWPAEVWSLAWSPRGNEIALIADDRFPRGTTKLYTIDITSRQVTELAMAYAQSTPSWSPDGKKIVFQAFRRVKEGEVDWSEIVVIDRETRHTQKIGYGVYPSWSPDGNLIAFLDLDQDLNSKHLFTMTPSGTEKKLLVKNSGFFSGHKLTGPLVWSPDMRYIAYHKTAGMKGGQSTLYILDLKTKKSEKIFSGLDLELIAWKSAP